ncbi:MAG: Ig-like domain-containing protein [Paludibacteraceae bacterium]|nr:Ig-like domain-containing protein [Paludibacteraceae bacterium]
MIRPILKRIFLLIATTISVVLLLQACANRGAGPQGGIRDTTSPKLIKTSQTNKATMATSQQLEWVFDENIQLEKQQENIFISPPQQKAPTILGMGKKLSVNLTEDLVPNTTYTIDFGNAVVDLNEKNAVKDFSWSFSTGATIDTMQLSGYVIDAQTLAPYEGITVGIYKTDSDSAFFTRSFDYIARTNSTGLFTIRNIPEDNYQVFAIKDVPQAFYYDLKGKEVGFYPQSVTPQIIKQIHTDSIWNEEETPSLLRIDTVSHYSYAPTDILIKLFREERKLTPSLKRAVRTSRESFTILLSSPLDAEPIFTPLNIQATEWLNREKTNRRDSLVYWISDSATLALDTLRFTLSYTANDALKTDTLELNYREPRSTANKKLPNNLEISSLSKSSLDIADTLRLLVKEPIQRIDKEKVQLKMRVDTTWQSVPYTLQYDDEKCKKKIDVLFERQARASYRLELDSAAIESNYKKASKAFLHTFTTKSPDEYATLYINWQTLPPHGIVELMDAKETVIRTQVVNESTSIFRLITPGTYFVRLILDANQNGKWDAGTVLPKQQAEEVYYLPKKLVLRANWESIEEWNYLAKPLLEQRAAELPKTKK